MPESSDSTPPSSSALDAFGANEWLVDEMYEQYQRDPNSVDKAWWDFFKNHSPGGNGGSNGGAPSVQPERHFGGGGEFSRQEDSMVTSEPRV